MKPPQLGKRFRFKPQIPLNRQELAGEDLSLPTVWRPEKAGFAVLDFNYDTTKSQRSDPDPARALAVAQQFIQEGTPPYKTNRVGKKGERLTYGIGNTTLTFFVR